MNIAGARSEFSASIAKLAMRVDARNAAASLKQNTESDDQETDCTDLFTRLMRFVSPQAGTTSSIGTPIAADGSESPQPASPAGMTCSADFFVGRLRARDYYNAFATRQKLISALSDDGPVIGMSTDEQAQACLICNRIIQEILWFSQIPASAADHKHRQSQRDSLEAIFSEFLDFTDILALTDRNNVLAFAEDYANNNRSWRARRLLRRWLQHSPDEVSIIMALGQILLDEHRLTDAANCFVQAIQLDPGNRQAHRSLGITMMRGVRYEEAITSLATAQALPGVDDHSLAEESKRAKRLRTSLTDAQRESRMPKLALDEQELKQGYFHPETLSLAARLYRKYGTLCIANAFDPDIIEACRQQFMLEYKQYFTDSKHDDALQIGDRRFQVSIKLHEQFNQPGLYANPFVVALMKKLISPDVIIGSTVCATSLPGAKDQHLHKDHRALFTNGVDDDPIPLPPVAITTMIPLVALDEQIGTTLVKKKSHLASRKNSAKMAYQTPIVEPGGCFFMDLALSHKGQGNRTQKVRPIVNMVYSQHWFADNKNFKLQPPLQICPEEFKRVPEEHRPLLSWAVQPGPLVNR